MHEIEEFPTPIRLRQNAITSSSQRIAACTQHPKFRNFSSRQNVRAEDGGVLDHASRGD
jgi:hypothetical protein